jgi:hypothetical protein
MLSRAGRLGIASLLLAVGAGYFACSGKEEPNALVKTASNENAEQGEEISENPKKLPANELYVEARFDWKQAKAKKISEGKRVISNREDLIEFLDIEHHRSNVSSIEESQVVCLTNRLQYLTSDQGKLFFEEILRDDDRILVDASRPLSIPFYALGSRIFEEKKELRNIAGEFPELFDYSDWIVSSNGPESKLLRILADMNKSTVRGVNSSRKIKMNHMYPLVENSLLDEYLRIMENGTGSSSYWFEVVDGAMGKGLDDGDSSLKIARAKSYLQEPITKSKYLQQFEKDRVENIIFQIGLAPSSATSWYITNSGEFGDSFYEAFEEKGIRYISYGKRGEGNSLNNEKSFNVGGNMDEMVKWLEKNKKEDGKELFEK